MLIVHWSWHCIMPWLAEWKRLSKLFLVIIRFSKLKITLKENTFVIDLYLVSMSNWSHLYLLRTSKFDNGCILSPVIIDKRCFISSTVKKLTLAPIRKLHWFNLSIQSNHAYIMHIICPFCSFIFSFVIRLNEKVL